MAMRMWLCTWSLSSRQNVCHSSHDVEAGDQDRDRPGEREHPARRDERAHLPLVAGEQHQREHRKRQLQAENDLAEDQQRADAALAVEVRP